MVIGELAAPTLLAHVTTAIKGGLAIMVIIIVIMVFLVITVIVVIMVISILTCQSGTPGSCHPGQKRWVTGLIAASVHLWQC